MREGANLTSVLWISGAPGSGKTTTGWGVFRRVLHEGGSVAYFDVDQLGLIGPAAATSTAKAHAVKSDNAARVVSCLAEHGVAQVVVSGIVDPAGGLIDFASTVTFAATLDHVRLRCDWDELRRRFLERGSSTELLDQLRDIAAEYDRTSAPSVDTTWLTPEAAAEQLAARCVVAASAPKHSTEQANPCDLPTLVVSGATAVGKSTVAWSLLKQRWQRGIATAYVDAEQLGFHGPAYDRDVHRAVYRSLVDGYAAAGAQEIITVTRDPALGRTGSDTTRVLLDADDATLGARVTRRSAGSAARLPGDEIVGAVPDDQRRIRRRARAEAAEHRNRTDYDLTIDTSDEQPETTAQRLSRGLATRRTVS